MRPTEVLRTIWKGVFPDKLKAGKPHLMDITTAFFQAVIDLKKEFEREGL